MKTHIFWVVGSQRSGKTTITSALSNIPNITVVNIGEVIRKSIEVSTFKEDINPYAPSSCDKFVINLMYETINKIDNEVDNIIIFDSAPRNNDQFKHLLEIKQSGFGCTVVFINEKYKERLRRAKLKYNEQEMRYFHKREIHEAKWLLKLRKRCLIKEINIFTIGCSIEEAYGNFDLNSEV